MPGHLTVLLLKEKQNPQCKNIQNLTQMHAVCSLSRAKVPSNLEPYKS